MSENNISFIGEVGDFHIDNRKGITAISMY